MSTEQFEDFRPKPEQEKGWYEKREVKLTIAAEELLGLAERSLALMTSSWRGGQGRG